VLRWSRRHRDLGTIHGGTSVRAEQRKRICVLLQAFVGTVTAVTILTMAAAVGAERRDVETKRSGLAPGPLTSLEDAGRG